MERSAVFAPLSRWYIPDSFTMYHFLHTVQLGSASVSGQMKRSAVFVPLRWWYILTTSELQVRTYHFLRLMQKRRLIPSFGDPYTAALVCSRLLQLVPLSVNTAALQKNCRLFHFATPLLRHW